MMATTDDELKNEDEVKIQETRGDPPPIQSIYSIMNSYAREFIFVLAVAFTAIAALQNGPLKSRGTLPPVPFFLNPSLITDYYDGGWTNLMTVVLEKDISIVLFYAPWDAKSINMKNEFEKVARFYHNEVFFASINCWYPNGECSDKFKLSPFPRVNVYVNDVGGIEYKGPLVANYFIAFLDNILSPVVTLQHTGELLDLQTKHEGVLVGYFNFKGLREPWIYKAYYVNSLQALTTDPTRRLCFAVITNFKIYKKFKMKTYIELHLWNRTEHFSEKSLTGVDLLQWAFSHLTPVTSQWVTPPGTKSHLLSDLIEKKATLILFTPRNLVFQSTPYFDLFREVALDYYNCNNSALVTSLVHRVVLQRHISQEASTKLIRKCQSLNFAQDIFQGSNRCDLTCCQEQVLKLRLSKSEECFCRVCIHHIMSPLEKMKLSECENTLNLILKSLELTSFPLDQEASCRSIETSYPIKFGPYHRLSLKCDNELQKIKSKTLVNQEVVELSGVRDDHVVWMAKNMDKQDCNRLKIGLNYSELNYPEFPTSLNANWQVNFTGLGCRTNRSLLFIAMDTTLFHSFAESLGIDILNLPHQSVALIVDAKQESSFLLDGDINKKSLVEFIKNYTSGTVDRFLRSTVHKLEECTYHSEGRFCLKELTTATFLDYVLDNETDVVVMYYAPWCATCSAVFHIFLSVANYFSSIKLVKFARISGDDHDLPWEYTVEKYPSIIFFPAERKAESIEFPPTMHITTTNLFRFILLNSQPKVRWIVAMRLCNRECVANNLAQSSMELRRLFREYHITLNQINFQRQVAQLKSKSKFKKFMKVQKDQKEPFSYQKHLVYRIREKRHKIKEALHLLYLLRKKRDVYLKEASILEKERLKRVQEAQRKIKVTPPPPLTPKRVPFKTSKPVSKSRQTLKDEL